MAQAQSPVSHRGDPGSIPGQSTWCLWRTKVALDRFLSDQFVFLLILSSHYCSTLVIFVQLMLSSEGQTEGAVPRSFGQQGALNINIYTVVGEGFQNISGDIVCSFTNSASTTDVTR
jgi:hypothetical protein